MNTADREAIRKNTVLICSKLNIMKIIPHLYQNGLLGGSRLDSLMNVTQSDERLGMEFIQILLRSGPRAFALFWEAIAVTNQKSFIEAFIYLK